MLPSWTDNLTVLMWPWSTEALPSATEPLPQPPPERPAEDGGDSQGGAEGG